MTAPVRRNEPPLPGLDGLRGLACLLVFFYHLRWEARPSDGHLVLPLGGWNAETWLTQCDIGVAIFFVLSGLLLSLPFWRAIMTAQPWPAFGPYLWRRACRIVPAYYAVLIVVYLLRDGTYTFYGALDFLLHATFLHPFVDYAYYSVHPVLWTIGIEFQFYLLLPALMAGVAWLWRRAGPTGALAGLLAGTWGLDLAAQATLGALAPHVPDRFLSTADSVVVSGTVFSYLKLFAFGIIAAWAVVRWPGKDRRADLLCLLSVAGVAVLIGLGHEAVWRQTHLLGWPLNALLLTVFAGSLVRSHVFARLFSARWLAATGTISYGIYLWHEAIQHAVLGGTLRLHWSGWGLFCVGGLLSLTMTVLVATLSWRYLERHALRQPYPFAP